MDALSLLRQFLFPGGEDPARLIRAAKLVERGEMRSSPEARWMPFTAEETVQATHSGLRWEARFGGGRLGWIAVTDAYENGHGFLAVKLGGLLPVKKVTGPEFDKGELQRYLASVVFCPPMLLNNPSLEWTAPEALTVLVRDRQDPTGAVIELNLGEDGKPREFRAERPRLVGKQAIPTPWIAASSEFREWEGMRIATRLEVAWRLPSGPFTYFRSEVTSFSPITR